MSKKLHVGLALGLGTLFLICCAVSCNTGDTDLSPGTPSPTAQQGLTSRETAYIAEFRENVDLLAGAISSLEILIQDPRLYSEDWLFQMDVAIDSIEIAYSWQENVSPPGSMSLIHRKYIEATEYFDRGANLLDQGVNAFDVGTLEEAMVEIELGAQLISEAEVLLEEFVSFNSI